MDWTAVAKVALAVYLIVSVSYVVAVYRRRLKNRSSRRPVRPDPNPFYLKRWDVAPTPLPEWAYLDDDEAGPDSKGYLDVPNTITEGRPEPGR